MDNPLILIIDDDTDILECLKDVLENEGYTVATADSGREALAELEKPVKPKLILLDLMMPVMNGAEFIAEMRNSSADLMGIPTIIMSAGNSIEQKSEHLRVFGHIKKPFDFDILLETVRRSCA